MPLFAGGERQTAAQTAADIHGAAVFLDIRPLKSGFLIGPIGRKDRNTSAIVFADCLYLKPILADNDLSIVYGIDGSFPWD